MSDTLTENSTSISLSPEVTNSYEVVIGLEVHAQLLTQSKAFSRAASDFGPAPNTNTDPVVLGHPGTLPTVNRGLVEMIVKMGLATNCSIRRFSTFSRKNYFYPDLPKGYQISQYEDPICHDGWIDIELADGSTKRIGITRIHMEEDSGKSIHDLTPTDSLVDLNRAGASLIEIVSEPDIRSSEEAYLYLTQIKSIVTWLDICSGNMEDGALRCDANVSVRKRGAEKFGTKTEVKNMNSFRGVEKAIEYEILRQIELIESGGSVVQETMLWDANLRQTRAMRSKEMAHDYRYFPEPDLPPVIVSETDIEEITSRLPELAPARRRRFTEEFGIPLYDAGVLTDSREVAEYFEEAIAHLPTKSEDRFKGISNLMMSEVMRELSERKIGIDRFTIDPKRIAELVEMFASDTISSRNVKDIFAEMLTSPKSPKEISEEKGFVQVSDESFIEETVDAVLAENSDAVEKYRDGKTSLIGFFVGETMKRTRGKANPKIVNELLRKKLDGGA
ncbi:MAG: Asp-tRNA(Asn)/Glu-tRNA(Gln) amidotransferase subunit GatB [Ignavibacteriae bacterium]|nr:Asp-tRNA(Asn)/Glu-tRNA(Gln) amidotransferase subunit GatB [Ignavibacteriota bacterium]MCB9216018.1 Asp-tRNA(Asn)/Glu-tRNA(Gln) amidotransferase subunit GatB [Ignavibacteria bacterium]